MCLLIFIFYIDSFSTPIGLENVAKYPDLFDLLRELNPDRWSIQNLEKLAGRNFVRVFEEVEKVTITFLGKLKCRKNLISGKRES